MEPEGSLPLLQQPTTCPYPEPDQFSPCPHIPYPEDPYATCMPTEENQRYLMGHTEYNVIAGCGFSGCDSV
jgi:hypothetical protein